MRADLGMSRKLLCKKTHVKLFTYLRTSPKSSDKIVVRFAHTIYPYSLGRVKLEIWINIVSPDSLGFEPFVAFFFGPFGKDNLYTGFFT